MESKRKGWLVVLVILGALVLTGCGGGGGPQPFNVIVQVLEGDVGLDGVTLGDDSGTVLGTTAGGGLRELTLNATTVIIPDKDGYTFDPEQMTVTSAQKDSTVVFEAAAAPSASLTVSYLSLGETRIYTVTVTSVVNLAGATAFNGIDVSDPADPVAIGPDQSHALDYLGDPPHRLAILDAAGEALAEIDLAALDYDDQAFEGSVVLNLEVTPGSAEPTAATGYAENVAFATAGVSASDAGDRLDLLAVGVIELAEGEIRLDIPLTVEGTSQTWEPGADEGFFIINDTVVEFFYAFDHPLEFNQLFRSKFIESNYSYDDMVLLYRLPGRTSIMNAVTGQPLQPGEAEDAVQAIRFIYDGDSQEFVWAYADTTIDVGTFGDSLMPQITVHEVVGVDGAVHFTIEEPGFPDIQPSAAIGTQLDAPPTLGEELLLLILGGPWREEDAEDPADEEVSLTVRQTGKGQVNPSVGVHTFSADSTVALKATPASGWVFQQWVGAVVDPASPDTEVVLDRSKTVTAVFEQEQTAPGQSTLTIEVIGKGTVEEVELTMGSLSVYPDWASVELRALPADGWQFKEWIGDVSDRDRPVTIVTMETDKTVTVVFVREEDDSDFVQAVESFYRGFFSAVPERFVPFLADPLELELAHLVGSPFILTPDEAVAMWSEQWELDQLPTGTVSFDLDYSTESSAETGKELKLGYASGRVFWRPENGTAAMAADALELDVKMEWEYGTDNQWRMYYWWLDIGGSMTPDEYEITGRIVDDTGAGIADAQVVIFDARGSVTVQTDSDGNWEAVIAGYGYVTPYKAGYLFDPPFAGVNQPTHLEFTGSGELLEEYAVVTAYVTESGSGSPLEGALVTLDGGAITNGMFASERTGSDGSATFHFVPLQIDGEALETVKASATLSGYHANAVEVGLVGGEAVVVEIELEFIETPVDQLILFEDDFETDKDWTATGFWHRQENDPTIVNTLVPTYVHLPPNDTSGGRIPEAYTGRFSYWYGDPATGTFIGEQCPFDYPLSGGTSKGGYWEEEEPESEVFFDNNNIAAVTSGPTKPTRFTIDEGYYLTYIETYHYFNAGSPPGTIMLLDQETGMRYGPWQAEGRVGQGNVANAYWFVEWEFWEAPFLLPGTYFIEVSDPSTWSHNSGSDNRGFAKLLGVPESYWYDWDDDWDDWDDWDDDHEHELGANSGTLTSPIIDLRNATTPILTFMTWFEIESVNPNDEGYDIMMISVAREDAPVLEGVLGWEDDPYYDDFAFEPVGKLNPFSDPVLDEREHLAYTSGGFNRAANWVPVQIDLSDFAGDFVRIRFTFDTVDGLYNGFRGWFIDDLAVVDAAIEEPPSVSALTLERPSNLRGYPERKR